MAVFDKIVKYIFYPILARRDGLPNLMSHVKDLDRSQYWSKEQIVDLQYNRLKALLIHAYENTIFYKKRFDEAGFNPYTFKYSDEIKRIPVLTKNQIRENQEALLAGNYSKSQIHCAQTGGTTGVKMVFYRDNACLSPKEAALYRFEKWSGWDFGEREGIVWVAHQDFIGYDNIKSRIKNSIYKRQLLFPAAIMDEKAIGAYVKQLQKYKPVVIRAFPSPIFEVARFILDNKIQDIKLRGIITTGEPLFLHQRKIISQAFHCSIYDSYRCREVGPIAQECNMHNGMHINAECLYIETLKNLNDSNDDENGDIIITDLMNYAMPFIRYKIGDMAILSEEICPCGRGLPLLKKVMGRTGDMFYTPDKKIIAAGSLVHYLLHEGPGLLGQVQIIQNDLNHLLIKMTKDPLPTPEVLGYITNLIHNHFCKDWDVSFEFVDRIPREKSGKYRFSICNIDVSGLKQ
jgi:phenylacetate-CoA ligase